MLLLLEIARGLGLKDLIQPAKQDMSLTLLTGTTAF